MQIIAFSTAIGPIAIDAILTENHDSSLSITEIPIEDGTRVTDHALVLPKKLTLECATHNAAATYNALVAFQESRVPFVIVSGLFIYTNMLIEKIGADRDKDFSSVLRCRVDLKEIIIVSTSYVADPTGDGPQAGEQAASNRTTTGEPLAENRTTDAATADRVSGTINRGDSTAQPVNDNSSVLKRITG